MPSAIKALLEWYPSLVQVLTSEEESLQNSTATETPGQEMPDPPDDDEHCPYSSFFMLMLDIHWVLSLASFGMPLENSYLSNTLNRQA